MTFLIESLIACALFTLFVFLMSRNPIKSIFNYPPAIIDRCDQLGLVDASNRPGGVTFYVKKIFAMIIIGVLLGLLVRYVNGCETFLYGALTAYALWVVVNWFDALVLDCIWFCHDKHFVIPGTEDMTAAYHDYWFHIKGALIGMLLGIPAALVAGGIAAIPCNSEDKAIRQMCEEIHDQYPMATLQDVYKTCYQDYFGAEHLMNDTAAARYYLSMELEAYRDTDMSLMPKREPTGFRHRFTRVNLANVVDGELTENQLLSMFIEAASKDNAYGDSWAEEWQKIENIALQVCPDWADEPLQAELRLAAEGKHSVRHSETFRDAYNPHYRIVSHVLLPNEEASAHIIPEPKEYQQLGRKKHKLKEVKVDAETVFDNPDEYRIVVKRGKATIMGNTVWAKSTLAQLVDPDGKVADCEIHDWAAYPFRGFMHDTGRNYQPISLLKETLDLMSFYKLNYFHWHLTDHPAWRIECKAYPQLNDAQYQRKGRDEGKFYTYDEIREVIAYAKERGITVVPEIDIPGHSTFFKEAFGFTMDSKEGRKVLETCLIEFCSEIPKSDCPYLHIGSDEVWIADPQGFMQWIENLMEQLDRHPIAWDPGLPASDKIIRQIWNETAGSNAVASDKAGKYLDSFVGYLNYYDPMLFTSRLFLHTPAAQAKPDTSKALGGTLCLWNDVRVDNKENIVLHNGMVNGMMAFAERFWNGGNTDITQLADFEKKMALHRDRFHKNKMRWVANSQIEWQVKIDENEAFAAYGGAIDLDAFCQTHQIVTGDTALAVAQTVLIAKRDMDIEAWIGFCTPARSNRNGYGIGAQGHWEGGCQCFVNDTEILPPLPWNEPGKYNYHFNTWGKPEEEEPFTSEQFYWMRQPAKLHLTKGKNHVEIRVPKTYKGLRWSFAFIPVCTQPDGSVSEVEGIFKSFN